MELYQYLFENEITLKDFCKLTGKNAAHMSRIIHYKTIPGMRTAYVIENATKGRVKALELIAVGMKRKINREAAQQ